MIDPQLVERKEIFAGRVVTLSVDRVRLPNDKEIEMELVRHPGAAAIVPLHADGTVVLIRQARYAASGWLLEVPAGKLDANEAPETCAARELEEEAGLKAGKLTPLGFIWVSPGFTNERIWLYLATELTEAQQALEPDEVLTTMRLPLSEAVAMARRGDITDAKSVCALLRVQPQPA